MTRRPRASASLHIVDGPWRVGERPDPEGFADAVAAALAVERRADKAALFADDTRRYEIAVLAMGRTARQLPVMSRVDHRALETIVAAPGDVGRLARAFHPPWMIADNLKALRALEGEIRAEAQPLVDAAVQAAERGAGYVIYVEPGHIIEHRPSGGDVVVGSRVEPQPAVADALEAAALPSVFERDTRHAGLRSLVDQTAAALRRGDPIPVGAGARHEVLAESFRMLQGPSVPQGRLRIVYVDGSEGLPFPTGTLQWPSLPSGGTIRLGLMSMRHTELDVQVDGYWFRNRMVSLPRTMAETATDAANQSTTSLDDLTSAGITTIQLVHTGYEPAVVGCYQALRNWITDGHRPVRVEPLYLIRRDLLPGTPWGAS